MKKRGLNILLILLLVIIWFFVFKKTYTLIDTNEVVTIPFNEPIPKIESKKLVREDYIFEPLVRDPFTQKAKAKAIYKTKKRKSKNDKVKKKLIPQSDKLTWPKIQYFGFVQNSKKTTVMSLLKIDNRIHRVRKGNIVQDLTIVKVFNDSIIVKYNSVLKTIPRE